jgi:hypothetical protein
MTGLDIETFLHLLRADLGAWVTLGLIGALLALMAWTSWGSRRALRKCLVLSVIAHVSLALYGSTVPVVQLALQPTDTRASERERIRQIKVAPLIDTGDGSGGPTSTLPDGRRASGLAAWDKAIGGLGLADKKLEAPRSKPEQSLNVLPGDRSALEAAAVAPRADAPAPPKPDPRADASTARNDGSPAPPEVKPGLEDVAAAIVIAARAGPIETRTDNLGPSNTEPAPAAEAVGTRDVASRELSPARPDGPRLTSGDANLRARSRPGIGSGLRGPATPRANRPELALSTQPAARSQPPGSVNDMNDAPAERLVDGAGDAASTADVAKPAEGGGPSAEVVKNSVAPPARIAPPESDVRRRSRPQASDSPSFALATRPRSAPEFPIGLSRVTPSAVTALPDVQGAIRGRPLADIPEVYRTRLDPNRSARALRSGASPASEQAVERALDWLARHQDADGRWDGGIARYDDGSVVKGDDDFTTHCPPGEACFGECIYWEADTALTGLALLSYLGAGYTQTDGRYAETVGRGLDFLLLIQKPDGDLRGKSRAVGMYCHAMATIALCEAYALTGDERMREPVERAIAFLVQARARDNLAWRYSPGAPVGDTSILGWVVMALKSAREVGISVPSQIQSGTLAWLAKVSSGEAGGLARYQPQESVTPTMTAEAWVARQFLGVGGPGAASSEAADYLLAHGPKADACNLYYWYYGTLAMYQHGGDPWYRWNAQVRDELVRRQRARGHAAGSWDPDDSPYGAKGGRIYCTTLATLSLEVYYRYLRLYDDPKIPPALAPGSTRTRTVGRNESGTSPARPGTPR